MPLACGLWLRRPRPRGRRDQARSCPFATTTHSGFGVQCGDKCGRALRMLLRGARGLMASQWL
eukprot:6181208-Pleurochrysis_carterae.AAC.2